MTAFRVHNDLESRYKGTGHVIATCQDGVVIDYVYLRDVLPHVIAGEEDFLEALNDPELRLTLQELSARGIVYAGTVFQSGFIPRFKLLAVGELPETTPAH